VGFDRHPKTEREETASSEINEREINKIKRARRSEMEEGNVVKDIVAKTFHLNDLQACCYRRLRTMQYRISRKLSNIDDRIILLEADFARRDTPAMADPAPHITSRPCEPKTKPLYSGAIYNALDLKSIVTGKRRPRARLIDSVPPRRCTCEQRPREVGHRVRSHLKAAAQYIGENDFGYGIKNKWDG